MRKETAMRVVRTALVGSILAVFIGKGGQCCAIVPANALGAHAGGVLWLIGLALVIAASLWLVERIAASRT